MNETMTVEISVINHAYRNLNKTTFGVWLYCYQNRVGEKVLLSCEEIIDEINISKTKYYESLKELKEKGYLIQIKKGLYKYYVKP